MKVENPRDVFLMLLSNVRRTTERTNTILNELSQVAQEPEIKEALEARAFVSKSTLEKIDERIRARLMDRRICTTFGITAPSYSSRINRK